MATPYGPFRISRRNFLAVSLASAAVATHGGALAVAAGPTSTGGGTTSPSVTLTPTQLGNVFTTGEPVQVRIGGTSSSAHWRVTDAHGATIGEGDTAPASAGLLGLACVTEPGWYRLEVADTAPGSPASVTATTLAVLAPHTPSTSDLRWGVCTHFQPNWGYDTTVMPLISKGGFGSIRDEARWEHTETTRGVYTWSQAALDFVSAAEKLGLDRLMIAAFGNPLYETGLPTTPESIQAFGDYCAALVKKWGVTHATYEAWNEPNNAPFAGSADKTKPEVYFAVLKQAYTSMKQASPEAVVVAPGLAGMDVAWLDQLFALGGLKYMDALSIHPYNWPLQPEALNANLDQFDAVVKKYNNGTSIPIWITEHGWPTGSNVRAVPEVTAAHYIASSMAIALARDVKRYYVYDMVDDGHDLADPENNFGLVHDDKSAQGAYTPKPAFAAAACAIRQSSGYRYEWVNHWPTLDEYIYKNPTAPTLRILWSHEGGTQSFLTHGDVRMVDGFGRSWPLRADSKGMVSVQVGPEPIYLVGEIDASGVAPYRLSAPSVPAGQTGQGRLTVDNASGAARTITVTIDGVSTALDIPAGSNQAWPVTLPASTVPGPRTYVATVREGGAPVAQLMAPATVTSGLLVQTGHVLTESGTDALSITVTNQLAVDQRIAGIDWVVGQTTGTLPSATVAANSTSTFLVDLVGRISGDGTQYTVTVHVPGQADRVLTGTLRQAATYWPCVRRSVTVDGTPDDLSTVPALDLVGQGNVLINGYGGATDLSGRIWLTWDAEALYLSADIMDNVHDQSHPAYDMWQADSLQFAIAGGTPGEASQWNEIGLSLNGATTQVYRWSTADGAPAGPYPEASAAVSRDEATKHTRYEIRMPWGSLGLTPTDRILSFSALVNDADGSGRRGYIEWASGIGNGKDSTKFAAFRLVDEALIKNITIDGAVIPGAAANTTVAYQLLVGARRAVLAATPWADGTVVTTTRVKVPGTWSATATSPHGGKETWSVVLSRVEVLYLSDVVWTSATCGNGTVQRDHAIGGGAITLLGADGKPVTYAKGLGTHADSEIRILLAGRGAHRFQAWVGEDRDAGENSQTLNFEVWGDGTKLWSSGSMGWTTPQKRVDIDVTGVTELRLLVNHDDDNNWFDHGSWADAKLLPADTTLSALSVNGVGVPGFTPEKTRYTVVLGGRPRTPVVTPVATDRSSVVTVRTTHTRPRESVITVKNGGIQRTYTITYERS